MKFPQICSTTVYIIFRLKKYCTAPCRQQAATSHPCDTAEGIRWCPRDGQVPPGVSTKPARSTFLIFLPLPLLIKKEKKREILRGQCSTSLDSSRWNDWLVLYTDSNYLLIGNLFGIISKVFDIGPTGKLLKPKCHFCLLLLCEFYGWTLESGPPWQLPLLAAARTAVKIHHRVSLTHIKNVLLLFGISNMWCCSQFSWVCIPENRYNKKKP